jgi:hypothetical protein
MVELAAIIRKIPLYRICYLDTSLPRDTLWVGTIYCTKCHAEYTHRFSSFVTFVRIQAGSGS